MTWVKIDDQMVDNRKIDRLSDRAFRLYVAGLCFCGAQLTDGVLFAKDVQVIRVKVRATKRHVEELVEGELWLPTGGGGFQVKDFLKYNPTSAQVKQSRERSRERVARFRNGAGNGVTNGVRSVVPSLSRKEAKTLGEHGLFQVPAGVREGAG